MAKPPLGLSPASGPGDRLPLPCRAFARLPASLCLSRAGSQPMRSTRRPRRDLPPVKDSCRMTHGRTKAKKPRRKTQVLDAGAAVAAGGDPRGRGSAHGLRGVGDGAARSLGVAAGRSVRHPARARLQAPVPLRLPGSRPVGVACARRRLGSGPPRPGRRRRSGAPGISSGLAGGLAAWASSPRPGIRPVVKAAGARGVSRAVPSLIPRPLAETSATGRPQVVAGRLRSRAASSPPAPADGRL